MFEAGSVDPDAVSIVGVDDGHLFPGEERGIWVGVRVPFVFAGRKISFSARAFAASGQMRLVAVEEGRAFAIRCGIGAWPGPDCLAALLRKFGLELVCESLTNPEIGPRPGITPKTVEHHVSRLAPAATP